MTIMKFSDIVQRFDAPLNALYRERDARRARDAKMIDLVSGNVNQAGLVFPPASLKQALTKGAQRAEIYAPNPLGQPVARAAVSAYYKREGVNVPADQIVLTAGTSLSYFYLFKLLANPDDEILCPTPNYALLNSIADLAGVRVTSYGLREGKRWNMDLNGLRARITARTRAIVLISPHNPTGAVATEDELAALTEIASKHNLPIISDEVFSAFVFNGRLPRPAQQKTPLLFTLNGLSKMFALPGMKLGWIGVTGQQEPVKKALQALDMISDTFLPVNEAVQFALPDIFTKGKKFLAGYQQEIGLRAERASQLLKGLDFVKPEGGFYLTLKVKGDEEKAALNLLRKEGILVHPGYFYDLEGSHLVLSFVSPPNVLKNTLNKIRKSLV
jgi:alanine-synthesizing transaminase